MVNIITGASNNFWTCAGD